MVALKREIFLRDMILKDPTLVGDIGGGRLVGDKDGRCEGRWGNYGSKELYRAGTTSQVSGTKGMRGTCLTRLQSLIHR